MDVAGGDTVFFVGPTPEPVLRVVPSTISLVIYPAFESPHRSIFLYFLALRAPKPKTELANNTHSVQDCNLCSPVPGPVLPSVMDVNNINIPLLTSTVGSITNSVERREADEIERREEQLNEHFSQLDRQQEHLTHVTARVNQLLLGKEALRSNCWITKSGLEDMQKTRPQHALRDFFYFHWISWPPYCRRLLPFIWPEPSSTPVNISPTKPTSLTADTPSPAPRVPIPSRNFLKSSLLHPLFQP